VIEVGNWKLKAERLSGLIGIRIFLTAGGSGLTFLPIRLQSQSQSQNPDPNQNQNPNENPNQNQEKRKRKT
jgi:hypothetical protein